MLFLLLSPPVEAGSLVSINHWLNILAGISLTRSCHNKHSQQLWWSFKVTVLCVERLDKNCQITVTVMFLTSPPSCGPAYVLLRRVWYKVALAQALTVYTTGTYSNSSTLQSKGLIHKLTDSQTGFKWTPLGQTDIPVEKLKGKIMTHKLFSVPQSVFHELRKRTVI